MLPYVDGLTKSKYSFSISSFCSGAKTTSFVLAIQEDGFINDNADNFGIDNRRFGRELELKKVTVEFMGLTLQDINDKTCYKEDWFEYLNEDGETI